MSKNVKIANTNYNNVPSITVPLQTSGTASFYDVSDTTATASDVASGKLDISAIDWLNLDEMTALEKAEYIANLRIV